MRFATYGQLSPNHLGACTLTVVMLETSEPDLHGLGCASNSNEVRFPESYRRAIDLRDPKTVSVLKKHLMDRDMMRDLGVQYILLPESAYGRFLTGAHYYFAMNRNFLLTFFKREDDRYELVRSFEPESARRGARSCSSKSILKGVVC